MGLDYRWSLAVTIVDSRCLFIVNIDLACPYLLHPCVNGMPIVIGRDPNHSAESGFGGQAALGLQHAVFLPNEFDNGVRAGFPLDAQDGRFAFRQ